MNFKEQYPIHLRVGILSALVLFILAFLLVPAGKVKEYKPPNYNGVIRVEKMQPISKILEPPPPQKPKLPVAAKSDKEVQQETIGKTEFSVDDRNRDDIHPFEFVPYDKAPEPINLKQVKKMVEYPEIAIKLGIEGRVWLRLWVDEEGNVRQVKVLKGVHPLLDEAARKAYMHLKFHPAMQRDKPVAVWVSMYFDFKIE